jgi:hypothetical protein
MGRTLAMTRWQRAVGRLGIGLVLWLGMMGSKPVLSQAVTTTTVQGTVFLANGTPGSGTVLVSWPAFTTASGQQVAAGNTVVTVGVDGFLSVNLAPNAGANPAGLYYTAVFHLSDGTVNTQYWPGDALLLTANAAPVAGGTLSAQVVVRTVTLTYSASNPDVVQYSIAFSNDWANDLAVKTTRKVPVDAWLPAAISPTYLANLNQLAVTTISPTAVSVQANVTPPTGGGFEVRRRDFDFQPGEDADLVMRSNLPNFEIPRVSEADRFYIRMYDGSTPPNYSEHSVGLFVNLPLSTSV